MDADRKKTTFLYLYSLVYSQDIWEIWDILDFENIFFNQNGYEVPLKKNICVDYFSEKYRERIQNLISINEKLIDVSKKNGKNYQILFSGDADYNLKKWNKSKETHSFCNFSLLPCNGGINTKKGARYGYNEQFGQFLQAIKVYYQISNDNQEKKKKYIKSNLLHFGRLKKEYQDLVLDFYIIYFALFDNFENYCLRVHLIEEQNLNDILDLKLNKDNYERITNAYWSNKREMINKLYSSLEKKELSDCLSWDLDDDK